MTFVITTFNWKGTGKPFTKTVEFGHCFKDMKIGDTNCNHRYAITRIS